MLGTAADDLQLLDLMWGPRTTCNPRPSLIPAEARQIISPQKFSQVCVVFSHQSWHRAVGEGPDPLPSSSFSSPAELVRCASAEVQACQTLGP